MNSVIDFFKRLFGIDQHAPKVDADECSTPACGDARTRASRARNGFISACNTLRSLHSISSALQQIQSTPWWILVVMIAVAALLGGLVAIVFWALIAAWAITWILLPVVGMMAAPIAAGMNTRKDELVVGLKDVKLGCTVPCQGDTSIPECSLT